MVRAMEIRFSTGMQVFRLQADRDRIVFIDTSFVAEFPDGITVTGRLSDDGDSTIGLQDLTIRADPDGPITPERLRDVRWSKLLDAALDYGAVKLERTADGQLVGDLTKPSPGGADVRRLKRTGGRRRLDDDHYREVASTYREALTLGDPPTKYVATKMNAARSTAGEWVQEARARGLLGPAPRRGAKGELR
jgi:hypothetical protein